MFKDYDKLFVWDTETCGFNAQNDDILEVGGILLERQENGKFAKKYAIESLIKTNQTIRNSHIHGITNAMCDKDGITKQEMFEKLKTIFEDKSVLIIGHNIDFDIKMVNGYFGKDYPDFKVKNDKIDTMTIMQYRIGQRKGSKLEDCVKKYNIQGRRDAHRALSDVEDTLNVLRAMYKEDPDIEKFIVKTI